MRVMGIDIDEEIDRLAQSLGGQLVRKTRKKKIPILFRKILILFKICPSCGGRLFRWSSTRLDCKDCSDKIYDMDFNELLRRSVQLGKQKDQRGYSGKKTRPSIS